MVWCGDSCWGGGAWRGWSLLKEGPSVLKEGEEGKNEFIFFLFFVREKSSCCLYLNDLFCIRCMFSVMLCMYFIIYK